PTSSGMRSPMVLIERDGSKEDLLSAEDDVHRQSLRFSYHRSMNGGKLTVKSHQQVVKKRVTSPCGQFRFTSAGTRTTSSPLRPPARPGRRNGLACER